MMKTTLLLSFFGTLVLSSLQADHIKVYTSEEPPLNFSITQGRRRPRDEEVTGFATDVVREILARTDHRSSIQSLPWPRAYQYAQEDPHVILYSMSRHAYREDLFKWIGPIARKRSSLFALKKNEIHLDNLEQAKLVMSIGTVRGDSKERFLMERGFTNLESTTNWDQGLKKLLAGRVTLWTSNDLDAPAIARQAGVDINDIEAVLAMDQYDLYIGVSRLTPDGLVVQWQAALDGMKEDGTFERIARKWAAYYGASDWVVEEGMLQVRSK